MAFSLNLYRNYVDISTPGGVKLINSAIHQFKDPLVGTIKLSSENAAKAIQAISTLANQYGYEYLLKNLPSEKISTPAAAAGDPAVITFGNPINLLETFSDANIQNARKYASVIWGDASFSETGPMTIRDLKDPEERSNHTPPRLTQLGKDIIRDRMHSKILAHQIMVILDEEGRRTLSIEKDLYTWKAADGRDVEFDGFTMAAIVLSRIKPHYQVDMFNELTKVKALTLKQFGNNVVTYLDEMKAKKLLIDEKDAAAYTDRAYVKDIFTQLKLAPVDAFAKEYEQMETKWLRNKEVVTSITLRQDAIMHFTQLDNDGKWKGQHSAHEQIVILTTKFEQEIKALTSELKSMKDKPSESSQGGKRKFESGKGTPSIAEWRVEKVDNGKEFNQVEMHGREYYWCEDGHFYDGKKCGMYCNHKPGAEHQAWYEKKQARKQKWAEHRGKREKETTPPATSAKKPEGGTRKLALSEHLKAAMATQCGVDEEHFQEMWNESCSETGNWMAPTLGRR